MGRFVSLMGMVFMPILSSLPANVSAQPTGEFDRFTSINVDTENPLTPGQTATVTVNFKGKADAATGKYAFKYLVWHKKGNHPDRRHMYPEQTVEGNKIPGDAANRFEATITFKITCINDGGTLKLQGFDENFKTPKPVASVHVALVASAVAGAKPKLSNSKKITCKDAANGKSSPNITNVEIDGPTKIPGGGTGTYRLNLTGIADTDGNFNYDWQALTGEPDDDPDPTIAVLDSGSAQTTGLEPNGTVTSEFTFELGCDNLILTGDEGSSSQQSVGVVVNISDVDFTNAFEVTCIDNATVNGDPHFKTWIGHKYDFHGVCDMVLLKNPHFNHGMGMDIHVRSKPQRLVGSYIESVALRIGENILEVRGGSTQDVFYWVNGIANPNLDEDATLSGFKVSYKQISRNQKHFKVKLDKGEGINIKTYKHLVNVFIGSGKPMHFEGSLGLMGSFDSGHMVARDGETIMDDDHGAFGREWQVLDTEPMLFHTVDGPQYPEACKTPWEATTSNDAGTPQLRRRLLEESNTIGEEAAMKACAHVKEEDRDDCVFDVLASNDAEMAGAY